MKVVDATTTTTVSSSSFREKALFVSKKRSGNRGEGDNAKGRKKVTRLSSSDSQKNKIVEEEEDVEEEVGKLNGKVALITGGNSGIGKATATLFVSEGATVIITGRRQDIGEEAVQDIIRTTKNNNNNNNNKRRRRGKVEFVKVDHSILEDCERVVQHIKDKYNGQIDILFNNAGIVSSGTAESTSEELWSYVLDINVTAVWRMCRLVLPLLRANNGGVIVNNASDWAIVGGKDAVSYCTSKGAVVQMTKSMALDHAHENIRINAICPGDTFVERWQTQGFAGNPQNLCSAGLDQANQLYGKELPMGRVGLASEIAKAVLFLSSDDSSFMTGTTLIIDGGNTAQ